MSPRLRPDPFGADHDRARELAAARLAEPLATREADFLADHLEWCAPCRAVAAEYETQRVALRALRHDAPEAPRDLWARTSAALDAEARNRGRSAPALRPAPSPRRFRLGGLALAPLAALAVVAVVVGTSLFNGSAVTPPPAATLAAAPVATPMTVGLGEVQIVTRSQDGSLTLATGRFNRVCPVGEDGCQTSAQIDNRSVAKLSPSSVVDALISPSRENLVVLDRSAETGGVYVFRVAGAAGAAPTPSPSASVPATPTHPATATAIVPPATPVAPPSSSASPTPPVATPTAAATLPTAGAPSPSLPPASSTASLAPSPTPGVSVAPATSSATVTPTPTESTPPPASFRATPTPTVVPGSPTGSVAPASPSTVTATPSPSVATAPPATPSPTPRPTVAVTPRPDGSIEIASDIVVVGTAAAYSSDGSRFAFTARPVDGSTGPDVYVWRTTETRARRVTNDHASVFASWLDDRLLISRPIGGRSPMTVLVDAGTGAGVPVAVVSMWRPTVGPDRRTAVWWDGSVGRDDADGWTPKQGRLVLGHWSLTGAGDPSVQVLATDDVHDWQVRWDDAGRVVAVWISTDSAHEGRLSLYAIDPRTGQADLAKPLLAGERALDGFSLESGRLAWAQPAPDGEAKVQVLAWNGDRIGRLELSTEDDATVVR